MSMSSESLALHDQYRRNQVYGEDVGGTHYPPKPENKLSSTTTSNAGVVNDAVTHQAATPLVLRWATAMDLLCHIAEWILVMAPAVFIGFGILIVTVHGQPTNDSKLGQKLEVAAKLGPTIFPLLFAAVATRSLRTLGRYICQRGTKLGTVELLIASRSVWGTLENQVLLRRCTLIGTHLLILWSLSPIGGQASLRALQRSLHVTKNTPVLRYLYTGPYATYLEANVSTSYYSSQIFISVLTSSVEKKLEPRDDWGNVRVPRLEVLPGFTHQQHGWLSVPDVTLPEQYSSLVGVPVAGLPTATPNLTVSFSLETSYMSLACAAWESFSEHDSRLATYTHLWKNRDPFRHRKGVNGMSPYGDTNVTYFIDSDMPSTAWHNASRVADAARPRRLHFVSAQPNSNFTQLKLSATTCSVTESHAEVAIDCRAGRECRATKMRRSLVDTRPARQVPLENTARMRYIAATLPFIESSLATKSTRTEMFLRNSASASRMTEGNHFVNLAEVPPATFAPRLQSVLNAWYQLSLVGETNVYFGDNLDPAASPAAYGYDFAQLPANGSVAQAVVDSSCRLFCSRSAQATQTHSVEVFSYSKLWLGLLFASAALLLGTGLAGAVVSRRTLAPDMLGYVASMTYNNRYLPLPERVGGELDAMQRVRILRELRVSLCDVRGDEEVGRLAFSSDPNVRALEKGRKYV